MASAPSTAFVTCLEAGPLEPQVLRLCDSLRRFGGRFATCPIHAVQPRFGPSPHRDTLTKLDRLGVHFTQVPATDGLAFATFANKPRAMAAAETLASEETLVFLDGDILVTDEPDGLELAKDEDFAACPVHEKGIASSGPDDPAEAFWSVVWRVLDVDPAQVPYATLASGQRIRAHFNGGVVAWRRSRRLGALALDAFAKLVSARVAHVNLGIHMFDEVAFSAMLAKNDWRWRALDDAHNRSIPSWSGAGYVPSLYTGAKLLHYHSAMGPGSFPDLVACLRQEHPAVGAWLGPQGPALDPSPRSVRLMAWGLRACRAARRKIHLARCRKVG